MRMPRVRFTMRTLLILVAVAAFSIGGMRAWRWQIRRLIASLAGRISNVVIRLFPLHSLLSCCALRSDSTEAWGGGMFIGWPGPIPKSKPKR
jgi:hypothetical protein